MQVSDSVFLITGGASGLGAATAQMALQAGARVVIEDLAGDGDHYAAAVVSEVFRGKSRVQQHQIVRDKQSCGAIPLRRRG